MYFLFFSCWTIRLFIQFSCCPNYFFKVLKSMSTHDFTTIISPLNRELCEIPLKTIKEMFFRCSIIGTESSFFLRFLDTDSSRPSLVHIPFGAGPRVCVGFRFVMMQVKLCLTRILLRFQATPATTTPVSIVCSEEPGPCEGVSRGRVRRGAFS